MKTLPLKRLPPLAEHLRRLAQEPVVLTRNGRAVAAVVALPNADAETVTLSTSADFMAIIERSRRQQGLEGGLTAAEMRRRLGHGRVERKARRRGARPGR